MSSIGSRLLAPIASFIGAATLLSSPTAFAIEIVRLQEVDSQIAMQVPPDGNVWFLQMGENSFAPVAVADAQGKAITAEQAAASPFAIFQDLRAQHWTFPNEYRNQKAFLTPRKVRDKFWSQVLRVKDYDPKSEPNWQLIETGKFAAALPSDIANLSLSQKAIASQQSSLTDPVIPRGLEHEIPWSKIEAAALPLDFQKILLAVPHDGNPAFAYQNGQWFTTWQIHGDQKGAKEDRWFAPAVAIGNQLVRPAPLSATTRFVKLASGKLVPEWTLTWSHEKTIVRQTLLSFQSEGFATPAVFVKLEIENAPVDAQLAIATGCRPNAHYWDDTNRERTPVPFLNRTRDCQKKELLLTDSHGRTLLLSRNEFEFEQLGPCEDLVVFAPENRIVEVCTPQGGLASGDFSEFPAFPTVEKEFQETWNARLSTGAQMKLPSEEWMHRIDAWQSQVDAITRVHYQGRDRLSYGAYFYQYYFGIEEAWPVVALAQWNHGDEAQRQAEIMLEPENLDKSNIHHQSRNGAAPWTAAVVARLSDDPTWLRGVAPAMIEAARWTQKVRGADSEKRSDLTRGLLPVHIYGGDVRDPATSLYASAMCWKGMIETADALVRFGDPSQQKVADELFSEANDFRETILAAMNKVSVDDDGLAFVPFALELPSLKNKNEGPYAALTRSRLGNYWNLFAPSFLQLQMTGSNPNSFPQKQVFDTMAQRGGLWGSLPRFYNGLDAAYAGGVIGYLLHASAVDARYRPQALAALESYFLHAASRNGYTFPEVAGLFPDRLDRVAFERTTREAPWSFGMYDANQYLEGHIPFTEPLGACAGQALWLIRDAMVLETLDEQSLPDGELVLLSTAPSDWFAQGKTIEIWDFPTAYGIISVKIDSQIDKEGEIVASYRFQKHKHFETKDLKAFRIRFAPPGHLVKEIEFDPQESGEIHCRY